MEDILFALNRESGITLIVVTHDEDLATALRPATVHPRRPARRGFRGGGRMRTVDLIGSAVSNTFRSKTRTILTILAIFVGAFTLTLTSGLGTGINAYIDDTVTSIGAADVMTVTKTPEGATGIAARRTGRIRPGCRRQRPARPSGIDGRGTDTRPISTRSRASTA